MTKINLTNVVIPNSSVSNTYVSVMPENGVLEGNKRYYAKTEEYTYKITVSDINITNLEFFYDLAKQSYFVMGHCSLKKKIWSEKSSSYNFTNEEVSTVRYMWNTYEDSPVRLNLYINNTLAVDFGSINNKTDAEPFLVKLENSSLILDIVLKTEGKVISTLPDQEGKRFDIDMNHLIAQKNKELPPLEIDPEYIQVPDKIFPPFKTFFEKQDVYSIPNEYTSTFIYIEDRYFYSLDFTSVEFQDMAIELNTRNDRYTLTGEYMINYKRNTLISRREKINKDTLKVSDLTWLDYDDTNCRLAIKLNGIDLNKAIPIQNTASINDTFAFDLGYSMDQSIEISMEIDGEVKFFSALKIEKEEPISLSIPANKTLSKFDITKAYIRKEIEDPSKPVVRPDYTDEQILSGERYIKKTMESFEGQRYVIGVRDINIKKRSFETQSELVTKKFKTEKPIKKVSLYSKEIVPDGFLSLGLEQRNEWIQYYISINDIDWHRISPMHYREINGLTIYPIVYEINSIAHNDGMANKAYLKSEKDVYEVRLKIILTRPGNLPYSTPMLQEYALKCMLEEGV